jgi:hypothetical protein
MIACGDRVGERVLCGVVHGRGALGPARLESLCEDVPVVDTTEFEELEGRVTCLRVLLPGQ